MASFLDTLFGGGAQQDAANANAQALQTYQGTALPALAQGYGTATGAANQAVGAYTPLANLGTQYNQAGTLALGALGAGGPAGTQAAQAAFTNAPGYTGAVTAGTDAINRQLAASGMSQSGNAAEDVGTFTQNLQNQQYNTWLSNLLGAGQTGVQATGAAAQGQAAGYGTLANLATQYGEDQSGVASGVASGTMADNNMVAAGQAAGAKNVLGAGLSLASLALAPVTGGASLAGMAGTALKGMNLGQGLFGGGSPTGYGGNCVTIRPLLVPTIDPGSNAFDFSPLAKLGQSAKPQDDKLANLAAQYASAPSAPSGSMPSYADAISGIESSGKYDLKGPVTKTGDQAYGKYQIMGANVPEWTQAALGTAMTPEQFLADPKAQDAVFQHRFGQYVDKYGPTGAAKAWFAGEGGMNNPNAKDQLGTSVDDYARRFNAGLGGQ